MTSRTPEFKLNLHEEHRASLVLCGDWLQANRTRAFSELRHDLRASGANALTVNGSAIGAWDSILMAFLLQCYNYCREEKIEFEAQDFPNSVHRLLKVATAVDTHHRPEESTPSLWQSIISADVLNKITRASSESLGFVGEISIALGRLVLGKANTRLSDFRSFCYQAGPDAFAIISLTSILVGMILAYLGAVQLQQFGAEIYVADLVVIGMLREMGALMTAIIMAGRTGAAYAAQLGTMQTNEEIDAITTMGISPIEFLVLPRMLALIAVMPLLTIYADILGILGGGVVASGLGITPLQYIKEAETAVSATHIGVGMFKSLVFATLIAIAGCRSGINSGRSSAAVGQAATEAVVKAIVYLIVADAAINIIFQQLDI